MPRAPRAWPERFPDASSGSTSEVESRQSAREKMSPRDRAENRPWRRRAAPATRPEDEDAINVTSGAARNPAGAWVRPSGMPAKVAMQRPRMPAAGTPEHLRVTVASREMLTSTKAGSNMPTRLRAPFKSTVTIPQSLRANSTERAPRSADIPTRRWTGMPESALFLTGAIESRRRTTPHGKRDAKQFGVIASSFGRQHGAKRQQTAERRSGAVDSESAHVDQHTRHGKRGAGRRDNGGHGKPKLSDDERCQHRGKNHSAQPRKDPGRAHLRNEAFDSSLSHPIPPRKALARGPSANQLTPLEPKPPSPRSVSSSCSTSRRYTWGTRWMTSWAMRSPLEMTMGSWASRLMAQTLSSPR